MFLAKSFKRSQLPHASHGLYEAGGSEASRSPWSEREDD